MCFCVLQCVPASNLCVGQDHSKLSATTTTLQNTIAHWSQIFDGLSFHSQTTQFRNSVADEERAFSVQFDQMTPDVWRADATRFRNFGAFARDGDFWFTVFGNRADQVDYDRLGFDHGAAASIEGSLLSHLELLSNPTHVLEVPLSEFVKAPGFLFISLEPPTRADSEFRVTWEMSETKGAPNLPAHGAFEWITRPITLLTRLEYFFGSAAKGGTKGSVVDVWFEKRLGRVLPVKVQRDEGFLRVETTLETVSDATHDRSFYRPEAFGLKRPAKPWPAWLKWVSLGLFAGCLAMLVRYARRRRAGR